jgi:glycosyltransferase involved in cell wall biosynthesis
MHLESRSWRVLATSRKRPRVQRLSDMLGTTWSRRHEYDVAIVEVFSGFGFVWAESISHLLSALNKPYVLSLHGGNLPEFASRWKRRINSVFLGAAAVVAQSGYLGDAVPAHRAKVRLIPNPLDLHLYPFRPRLVPQPRLVWIRSFHEVYNPSLAVQVVGLLKREFPGVALDMIGPDKGDGSLGAARDLAAKLGVERSVVFREAVPKQDVPQWLDRADVFLNTSDVDNTPVSVQEAMACGLCVITTDVGGVSYLARDQVEALLVPPRDADAMADAVHQVLVHPDLAARISRGARERVEGTDWSRVIEAWESLLSSVSNGRPSKFR